MATSKIQLQYYRFWTYSCTIHDGDATGTRVYIPLIALCLPGDYLSSYETEAIGYTDGKTGSATAAPIGHNTLNLTPVLLRMDESYIGTWIDVEEDFPQAGIHTVTARDIEFKIIETLNLSFTEEWWSSYVELDKDDYDTHVQVYSGSSNKITLDLTYQVIDEGKATQYLKLVSADNIRIGNTTYPSNVLARDFMDEVWNKSFDPDSDNFTGETVGKLIRYVTTNMESSQAYDIEFGKIEVGGLTEHHPPQRCKTGTFDADPTVAADRTTPYIFDFTGEWIVCHTGFNQAIQNSVSYTVETHPVTQTRFYASTPAFDNMSDNYAVINNILERNYVHVIPARNIEHGFEQFNIIHSRDVDKTPEYVDGDKLLNAYTRVIEMSPDFITPMEYYAGNFTADTNFEGKLTNITNVSSEPVYFWVETLKNWCTYTANTPDEACTVAELCIWNGFDDFVPLYKYIDNTRYEAPTVDALRQLVNQYHHSKTAWINLSAQDKKTISQAYQNMVLRSMQFRGFDFNRVKTVDIVRTAKYYPADYQGVPKRSWLDYLGPIGSIIRFANHTWGALLNASPVGWIYNGIVNDMTPWESMKAAGNHAKAAGVAALMAVVQTVGTITLVAGPSTYAQFQLDCAEAYNRLLSRWPEHQNAYELDHWQNLFAVCRYVMCPYDERYSSSDKTTFQTIRNTITPDKFYHVAGGFENRSRFIPYHLIPNPIGAMFAVRGSTGELMLAMSFMLSGPTREDSNPEHDYPKNSGVKQEDIDFANSLLREKLGAGYDKTGGHYMNFTGMVDDYARDPEVVNTLKTRITSSQILQENATNKSAYGELRLTANRSKTSSDADTNSINTLTKW